MNVNTNRLVRIKTYADFKKVSVVAIWKKIKANKIDFIEIDKCLFVVLSDDELKELYQ